MNHIATLYYIQTRFLALGPRFGLVVIDQGQGFGSRGSIWADFEIFEILGGAGDIYNSTTIPNYCDGPYIHLGVYVNEVPSAWTEVWSGSYRSRARFWFPGVAIWQIFVTLQIQGGAGDTFRESFI